MPTYEMHGYISRLVYGDRAEGRRLFSACTVLSHRAGGYEAWLALDGGDATAFQVPTTSTALEFCVRNALGHGLRRDVGIVSWHHLLPHLWDGFAGERHREWRGKAADFINDVSNALVIMILNTAPVDPTRPAHDGHWQLGVFNRLLHAVTVYDSRPFFTPMAGKDRLLAALCAITGNHDMPTWEEVALGGEGPAGAASCGQHVVFNAMLLLDGKPIEQPATDEAVMQAVAVLARYTPPPCH
jgi:hypothetical protein